MIDDVINQNTASDKSEHDQEVVNNQCGLTVIKKKFEQIDTPMGSSCALPPNLSSMSCDYVAGWRSFRSRRLQQRGAGEKERAALIPTAPCAFSALLPFTTNTQGFFNLKNRIRVLYEASLTKH